jgi:hypothetical protein
VYGILFVLIVPALAAAQSAASLPSAPIRASAAREAELRAAITAEPGDLARYFALADYFERRLDSDRADDVLKEALGVDPSSRAIYERRARLCASPFNPIRLGRIALDWLSVDATHPVPVLLAAGYRLRRASGLRGDGTPAALDEIDAGLRDLEGAVPANPEHTGLAATRVTLLQAKAALMMDRQAAAEVLDAASDAQRTAESLMTRGGGSASTIGPFATLVTAMLRPVPFGPPGAVRAGTVVPRPRVLTSTPLRMPGSRRGVGLPVAPIEVVIDHAGRVAQVFVMDSTEGYDQSVVDALQKWTFEPTRLDGRPVWVILTLGGRR